MMKTVYGSYTDDEDGTGYDVTYDDGQGNTYEETGYASKARKARKARKSRKSRKAGKSRKDTATATYASDDEGNAYASDSYEADDGSSYGDVAAVDSEGETVYGSYTDDEDGTGYDVTYDDGQGNTYEETGYASKARKARKARKPRKSRKAGKSRKDTATATYASDDEGNAYASDSYEADDGSSYGDVAAVDSEGETVYGSYTDDEDGTGYDVTYDDGQGNTYEETGYASKARKLRKAKEANKARKAKKTSTHH
ncbi:unnamed protein product [Ambrosiozyma monospora]|uniref:Unnamed protein product n=1 Tax=Ambrosiozyma monospora TaxID=43982 RepID=A0ACB5T8R5_AMBMO|nr:unnamed protein product [Ambrosiozyma monospora]